MKICFICDLHLPIFKGALQYGALDFAIQNIKVELPDIVVFAGDVTCDGDISVYLDFIEKMENIGIPFLYIPGNSDLRDERYAEKISGISSPLISKIGNTQVVMINDCHGKITDPSFVDGLPSGALIVMHHPPKSVGKEIFAKISAYLKDNPASRLFYAHVHMSFREGQYISLGALDPDKEIGECPCITYYDTETDETRQVYFDCPVPKDIYEYFGVSCYRPTDIRFAIDEGLKYIELRPSIFGEDEGELVSLIGEWRLSGGVGLSIHLPDIGYLNGAPHPLGNYARCMYFAELLGADRFTQHVPKIPVNIATDKVLSEIADYLAEVINASGREYTVGVENMHMTANENSDDTRRYGYIPEECIRFADILRGRVNGRVGINFDIGHARNNAPFSQTYQISSWLLKVGLECVGYHIHQVSVVGNSFVNHTAITEPYGRLISYASTFKMWSDGRLNKSPFIFEMDKDGDYKITLDMFKRLR